MSEGATEAVGIFLLRGINVGGTRRVRMADLKVLAEELGLRHARTYVASGNLVALAPPGVAAAGQELERALGERFGFDVPVVARTSAAWQAYLDDMPFEEAARSNPNLLMLALPQRPASAGALEVLRSAATAAEAVAAAADGFWIRYDAAVARSPLAPGTLDRLLGVPTTTRNVRTCEALRRHASEVRASGAPSS